MTFFEAAVEVLRRTGRPLHYKKITEVAVRDELLSHVGKAPDQTMSSRLTQEIKRQGKSVIVETRPGVYSIRDGEMDRLNEEAEKRQEREESRAKQRRSRGGGDQKKDDEQQSEEQSNKRRSRQRKRDSSGDKNGNKKSSNGRQRTRGSRRSGGARRRDGSKSKSSKGSKKRSDKKNDRKSSGKKSNGRSKSRSKSRSKRRSKGGGRDRKKRTNGQQVAASLTKHLQEGPVRLDGIAEAAYTVLQDGHSEAVDIENLADEIFDRKLVKFHTHDAAATVQAALANDNQIRRQRGHRPLFDQYDRSRWGLTEWGLPDAAINKEQTILSLSEEIRQDTLEHLGEALIDVQDEALEHIALTLLERLGYQNIKVSKRSSSGDVYFTADWRQGLADVRVCIQVTLEGEDDLSAKAVSAIRDTLHHYSAAEGVIIHLGDITSQAVAESRKEDKAPITLIDRTTFVELLIKHGIGVQAYTTPILMVDTTFIETLK
jgi:hypothetical protein